MDLRVFQAIRGVEDFCSKNGELFYEEEIWKLFNAGV